jgi:hypothetical protein
VGTAAALFTAALAGVSRGAPPATPATAPPPAAGPAAAVPAPLERHVLRIEDSDILVDLTPKDGANVGDELSLWRPVRLVHPVTHKVINDRYRIGTLRIVQMHDAIALARPVTPPLRAPAAGDVVVFERAPATPPGNAAPDAHAGFPPLQAAAPAAAPSAETGAASADPEARSVSLLFDKLVGASLITRIRRYERYAQANPNGRYTRTLLEEAAALRELVSARENNEADAPSVRHFDVPAQALDGAPLMLTVEMNGRVVGAILHARAANESGYRSTPMVASGRKYFTATLPPDRVIAPRIEYFVEAVRPSGQVVPVAGSPDAPLVTLVSHVPHAGGTLEHETTVLVTTDYADYNRLRGNDHVWQTEGLFTMRFGDVGVRSLSSGFGVYRGIGGSINDLDVLGRDPRSVGLTYGYVEGEFGIKPTVSLMTRAVLGLRARGTAGGAQLKMRIGSDLKTNVLFGGEVLGGIGLRGILELQVSPRGQVPVSIRAEVTNQPAGSGARLEEDPSLGSNDSIASGDVGVRGIVQVGYRLLPPLVASLRASYQGRTISHAGPGIGGALEFRW